MFRAGRAMLGLARALDPTYDLATRAVVLRTLVAASSTKMAGHGVTSVQDR